MCHTPSEYGRSLLNMLHGKWFVCAHCVRYIISSTLIMLILNNLVWMFLPQCLPDVHRCSDLMWQSEWIILDEFVSKRKRYSIHTSKKHKSSLIELVYKFTTRWPSLGIVVNYEATKIIWHSIVNIVKCKLNINILTSLTRPSNVTNEQSKWKRIYQK